MSSEPTNQRGPLQALGLGFHVEAGWVFAALPVETLSAGLETNIDETRSAVTAIPPSAISTEPEWVKLARELAYEAQVYNKKKAEELWEILDAKHGQRRFVPGIPPGFNIGDRVPVQPRRFRQVAFRVWPTDSAASCSDEALIGMRPMIGSARLLRLSKDRPTSPGVFIGGTGRRGLGHDSVLCK